MPVPVVLAIVRCVKALFQHEPPPVTLGVGAGVVGTTSIRELAVKAEKTVEEIMKSPPNLAITFTIGGGGAVPGAPPSGGAAAAASGTAVAAGAGGRS